MSIQKKKNQVYKYFRKDSWPEGLYQRGNIFWVRWTLADNSRIQRSLKTDSITEAKDELIIIKSGALLGTVKRPCKQSLKEVLETYWNLQGWRDQSSNKTEKSMINKIVAHSKIKTLEDFTAHKVTQYLMYRFNLAKELQASAHKKLKKAEKEHNAEDIKEAQQVLQSNEAKFGPVSYNGYRKACVTFFSVLISNDIWHKENHISNKVKVLQEDDKEIIYLERKEIVEQLRGITDLISEAQNKYEQKPSKYNARRVRRLKTLFSITATYLLSGLRRSEGLWLRREDIDLDKRVIHIRSKTIDGVTWKVKSGRSKKVKSRIVPICASLLPILKEQLEDHDNAWVFPSPEGLHWMKRNFNRALRSL